MQNLRRGQLRGLGGGSWGTPEADVGEVAGLGREKLEPGPFYGVRSVRNAEIVTTAGAGGNGGL